MKKAEKQFMIECLAKELIEMLMKEYGWDIEKSMDVLYSSEIFAKLEDERAGLYYQGAVYVYDFLKQEISTGTIAS
jgi:hypothetical protein